MAETNPNPSPSQPAAAATPATVDAKPVAFATRDGKRVEFTRTVVNQAGVVTHQRNGESKPNQSPSDSPSSAAPQAATPATPDAAAVPPPGPTVKQEPADDPTQQKPGESDAKFAARLAALARREAAFVQKQRSWDAERQRREAALQNQQEQIAQLRSEIDAFRKQRDEAKADPIKWLEFGGHNYDAASRQVLNDNRPDPEALIAAERERLHAELAKTRSELEQRLDAEKKAREDLLAQQQKAVEDEQRAVIAQFNHETVQYVKSNADKYPFIAHLHQEALVPQLIDAHFQQTLAADMPHAQREGRRPIGKIMSAEEAASQVENYYREQFQAAQAKLQPPAPPAAAAPAAPAAPQTTVPGQTPTLTNQSIAQPTAARGEFISEDERWRRALAAMDAAQARVKPTTA